MAVEHSSSGGGAKPAGGVASGQDEVLALVSGSPGGLIRAAADGEIGVEGGAADEAEGARLERLIATATGGTALGVAQGSFAGDSGGASGSVAFERALRPACNRCMCAMAGSPSASLKQKVEALAGAGEGGVVHGGRDAARPEPGRAPSGVRRGSRGRRLAMSFGATAILALAGVALYQGVLSGGTVQNDPGTVTARLVSFMSTEHDRTRADSEAAKAKFRCTDPARVCDEFRQRLGESPAMPELGGEHELSFVGAAPCGVPGGESIHVRFVTHHHPVEGQERTFEVSLFIQRDTGVLDLEEGQVYTMECAEVGVDATVQVWRKGSLVYYLVSDDAGDCDCFRAAAGVGEPTGVVRARNG